MSDTALPPAYFDFATAAFMPPAFNVMMFRLSAALGSGTETAWTVPEGCIALVQSAFFNFQCDATVGVREVNFEYRHPEHGHLLETITNNNNSTATTNREYCAAVGWPLNYTTVAADANLIHVQLPWLLLWEGCAFGISSGGSGGAGDTLGPASCSAVIWPRPGSYLPGVQSYAAPPVRG